MHRQTLNGYAASTLAVGCRIMLVFGLLVSGSIDRQAFAQETANIDPVASDAVQAHSTMQDFELDNTHSSLLFAVSHAGLSYTYGRFENCSGQIHLADDPAETYFRFEIEVASINTNNRLRDDHLLGPEFFDVKQFPKIMFQSTKVERDQSGARFNVTGTMSMHGSPKKITMPINMIGVGKGPMGKTRGGFMTKFTLQRSDFGIDALPKVIGDQIAITFSFEGILSPPPTATK